MEALDIYLADCKNESIIPEKPFKRSFNVRVSPKLHQKAALLAMENKISLNNFIVESIRERINKVTGDRL
jgi:predicted HicB family RNase H-like nuclease